MMDVQIAVTPRCLRHDHIFVDSFICSCSSVCIDAVIVALVSHAPCSAFYAGRQRLVDNLKMSFRRRFNGSRLFTQRVHAACLRLCIYCARMLEIFAIDFDYDYLFSSYRDRKNLSSTNSRSQRSSTIRSPFTQPLEDHRLFSAA